MQQEKESPEWVVWLSVIAGIALFVSIGAGASFGEIIGAVIVVPVVLIVGFGAIMSIILWITGNLKD